MIPDYVSGSDVAAKTGWNEDSMLRLFTDFVISAGMEDQWLDYLNNLADQELEEEGEKTSS